MIRRLASLSFRPYAVAAAALVLAACAMPPRPVTVSDVVEASAVVESTDPASRRARLKLPDGRVFMVQAGPAVRNFDQVKAGDRVVVRYTEALAAEVVKPGTGRTTVVPEVATQRAAAGQRPGGSETITLRGVVKVRAVDPANNTVDIVGLDGAERRIRVVDPQAQAFARGLKPGDDVQLTFTEAVAISVEPAK